MRILFAALLGAAVGCACGELRNDGPRDAGNRCTHPGVVCRASLTTAGVIECDTGGGYETTMSDSPAHGPDPGW
jgi:hypothetical protein